MPRQGIAPAPQRIAASTCSPHGRGRRRLQASFRRVPGSHLPETGLQAIQLSPYRADPPAHRPVRLGTATGFLACYFPHSPFGSRVSHQIQRHLLQSLPATRAIQQCASWRTQVAGLLGSPRAVRAGGHAQDVHVPGLHLHDEQHVQAPEENRVQLEEITRQQPISLSAQERPPGSVHVPRGRRPPPGAQDPPYCHFADLVAEPAQFTVDPAVSPGRILPRQPLYQVADVLAGLRAAGPVRVRPLAGDQPMVPCQQRARADQPAGT